MFFGAFSSNSEDIIGGNLNPAEDVTHLCEGAFAVKSNKNQCASFQLGRAHRKDLLRSHSGVRLYSVKEVDIGRKPDKAFVIFCLICLMTLPFVNWRLE